MTNCYRAPSNDFADSIIPLKGSCYLGNSSFVASTCACCGRGPVACTHEKAKGMNEGIVSAAGGGLGGGEASASGAAQSQAST